MFTRVDGPECPHCGCQQSDVVAVSTRRKTRGGVVEVDEIERRQCRFCDGRFFTDAPPRPAAVVVSPIKCPRCRSRHTRVTSTRGTLRWHRCDDCLEAFQSVEAAEASGPAG